MSQLLIVDDYLLFMSNDLEALIMKSILQCLFKRSTYRKLILFLQ